MAIAALVENTDFYRLDANRKLDPKKRSVLGQFMTPAPITEYMASLFNPVISGSQLSLLDPGAGVGSLTAAFVNEFSSRTIKPSSISVSAYEIEPLMHEYLDSTLDNISETCSVGGIKFNGEIRKKDFIKDGTEVLSGDLFGESLGDAAYTHVFMNPPYKKINSTSEHRQLLRSVGIETSNLYTAFLAIAVKLLKDNGELVAIVPRSFCNGPYFKPFRSLFLKEMAIKHIHLFESRKRAFKDDDVLQENIIFHAVKGATRDKVIITSSTDSQFHIDKDSAEMTAGNMMKRVVPYADIVKPNDKDQFIHIAASSLDQKIVERISRFNTTLDDLGIEISTGPVVDFRLKDDIRQNPEQGSVPLLYANHFNGDGFEWPKKGRKPNAIHVTQNTRKWLWRNSGHFVVTRRFTSKEEKRRIVASVYDGLLPGKLIGFENHLNVFHVGQEGMSKEMAYGLATYLNSTLLDKYFRVFNGHTQVNATDLRNIHYPDRESLEKLGQFVGKKKHSQEEIDNLIEKEIGIMADGEIDPIKVQKKIEEALEIVKALGMPKGQHNERSALTLLAILNLKPEGTWQDIERPLIGITPIMDYCRDFFGKEYAPNTRETFRRQTMHQFVDAGIALYNPDDPTRPVNSPKACYQISNEAFDVIVTYGTENWQSYLEEFLNQKETLAQRYAKERDMQMIPVEVADGQEITLTPGAHSHLIKDIIEEFAPRYAPGSEVIYVGDTGSKKGYFQKERLAEMGVVVDDHGKMPDVVLYFPEKNWLLLVESVTSHGPVDSKRYEELSFLFKSSKLGLVYVTAFPDRSTMGKYLSDISWETEVWVAEAPTHMIHFNGDRFLGPYEK
tara:strand:+ start:1404 stop:3929 length:2526 start_codon:yes stop_codon:yes gene_type:complete